jgi:hypothetical protein
MNRQIVAYVCGCLLVVGLLLAGGWGYWHEQPSGDAWVVEQPEQIVSGAASGQEVHVDFTLRNISSQPRRILGAEAC